MTEQLERTLGKPHAIMTTRTFNRWSLISSILLGCTLGLWLLSFAVSPFEHRLSITDGFHIGIWGGCHGPLPARLVFFNDKEYGPYRGSIVTLSGGPANSASSMTSRGWGDLLGVYYRYFHWPDTNQTLWTLAISLAYPLLLFSILPATWIRRRWRQGGNRNNPVK